MKRRSGYALLCIIILLGVVAVLLGSVTMQLMIYRKTELRREAQLQSTWLARAGLELAASRLLAGDDYQGEAVELIPTGKVRVDVRRDQEVFHITSEAAYLGDLTHPVVRALARSYRRGPDGKLEVLPGP